MNIDDIKGYLELPNLVGQVLSGPVGILEVVFISIACLLIANYLYKSTRDGILEPFLGRKSHRTQTLKGVLSDNTGDPDIAKVFREIYIAECFECVTGIYAEQEKREKIIALRAAAGNTVSWRTISNAREFIDFENGEQLKIRRPNIVERVGYFFSMFFAGVSILVGILAMIWNYWQMTATSILSGAGLFFVACLFAGIGLSQALPYRSAMRIRAAVRQLEGR